MTLFEYLSVAFSIVLALGAASLLRSLHTVFMPGRRYWVHAAWVVTLLFNQALLWWAFWSYSEVEHWDFLSFLLVLLQPGILYVCATSLVGDAAATTTQWREHFFQVRVWFFSSFVLYIVALVCGSWLILEIPLLFPSRAVAASTIAVSIVGIVSSSDRVHAVLPIVNLLNAAYAAYAIFSEPIRRGLV